MSQDEIPNEVWLRICGGGVTLPGGKPYTTLVGDDRDGPGRARYVRAGIGEVSPSAREYLERRVACMQEAVDREEWRQNDGDASRPEYWIGRLHEAKIGLNNLTQGLERRADGFGAKQLTGPHRPEAS